MRLKNLFILVLVLLVVFISLQDIRALTFDCEFRALSACTAPFNNIVFKASAGTNAHGAIYSDTAYTSANGGYGLCCNFYTSRPGTCTADGDGSGYADNKVFRLIGTTNAHAESPQQSTAGYTNICYGNLECVQVSSCPSEYPIDAFSISSFTNAHIGDFNSYGTYKICCKNPNEPIPPNCGDGNIQPPEECDDGSAANGVECTPSYGSSCNYCSSSCSILSVQGGYCSDGLTQTPPEACDDGNLIQTDTCSASCTVTFCGDGYLQTPNGNGGTEQCDDGNTNNGDGCSSTCQFEPCAINSASWSVSTAENNTQVTLSAVGNSQCAGQVVFDIGEVDGIINRDYAHIDPTDTALINVKQVTGSFNGGSPNVAAALWTAEWHQDTGSTTQDPEYVFRATAGPATYDDSGILTVTLPTGVCTLQEI